MKAQRKLTVLTRISKYLASDKLRILLKTFFESQFKCCPITWMFYSRTTNNNINRLHERALRLVYDDCTSTFDELQEKNNSFTAHHYNIQTLCIELYRTYCNLSQTIFSELFVRNHSNCNLRSVSDFVIPEVKTVCKGSDSLRYFGPIIWNLIPKEIKHSNSHCVKSVRIRSYSGPSFPAFGQNTDENNSEYGLFLLSVI